MASRNTILKFVLLAAVFTRVLPLSGQENDKTPQLFRTIIDASGAVIHGAMVRVESVDGTVHRNTESDTNGFFSISGLSAGPYRLRDSPNTVRP